MIVAALLRAITNAAQIKRASWALVAFGAGEKYPRYEVPTPATERPSALDYVVHCHHLEEIQATIPIAVQFVEEMWITQMRVAFLPHEYQELWKVHVAVSISVHGVEKLMRQLLDFTVACFVVGRCYVVQLFHLFLLS